MMANNLFVTGSSGFVGRNICPVLSESYTLISPTREQLNLKDEVAVRRYLSECKPEVVLHLANPNPSRNERDKASSMYDDSLCIFNALAQCSDLYDKMIYAGSGAEFDKRLPIQQVSEEEAYRSEPEDAYGRAKQEMNRIAETKSNIYNLRLFGCYGPTDHCRKFITHCIRSVLLNVDITIRRDCYFDYLYVTDLVPWIQWMVENEPKHHSYNASSGTRVLLSEIANMVRVEMQSSVRVLLLNEGLANEYTASNRRIVEESGISPATSLLEGIRRMIAFEAEGFGPDTEFDGR